MNLSLNEITSLGYKAASGAGMTWGLAEEAGKCLRWLAVCGQPGGAALLRLLDQTGPDQSPVLRGNCWQSTSAALNPIAIGAALADGAIPLTSGQTARLSGVIEPLLLLPFAASVSARLNQPVSVVCGEDSFVISPLSLTRSGPGDVTGRRDCEITLFSGKPDAGSKPKPDQTRAELTRETHDRLQTYAFEKYAPATKASRLLGAG